MSTDEQKIEKLTEFIQRDKFSTQAWNQRGLNPSSDELCQYLTSFFNASADKLVEKVKAHSSIRQFKTLLKFQLSILDKSHYDTEEKEFICDLFHELAAIVEVDFNDSLNKWLYGSVLTTIMKIQKIIRPERIVETLRQPCTKCEADLETHVLRKEKGLAATSFFVVRCNNCGELNLIEDKPDIKELRFGNYTEVETLHRDDYTFEQALLRMEQIKVFRE
jgi:hypothetical protein